MSTWKRKKTNEDWVVITSVLSVAVAIAGVILLMITNLIANNAAWSEDRAYVYGTKFVVENNINVERMTCARDSDNDGYGSCTVVGPYNTFKIYLECPTDWFQTSVLGATSCKEVEAIFKMGTRR